MSALALTSAFVAAAGGVSYTDSDPRGTLLTAQALLEHGTLALDAYPQMPSDYRVVERAGHRFYAYPPGTPIAALPAVAIARLVGLDMARSEDDRKVQRTLAALSVGITTVLASLLAVCWLPWPLATALAGTFVFATPVISTMSTALWSTDLTVMAALSALLLLARGNGSCGGPARASAIGALLGFAFWCRPTAFVLATLVILWAFSRAARRPSSEQRSAIASATALAGAVLLSVAVLVVISRLSYGTYLPDYYIGGRLAASDRFGTAFMAHVVSPSRGLLIFAPPTALAFVAAAASPRRVLQAPLATLSLVWICLHLVIVSRFIYWWGGYSFGSRLLVDVLPGLFAFSCAAAAAVRRSSRHWQALALLALVAASAAGIWINSVQGLFNPATAIWNASPSIDRFPGYAFDWRLPQFRATDARLDDRLRRHDRWLRPPLEDNVDYAAGSTRLEFLDWSAVEPFGQSAVRRSVGQTPSLRFLVSEEMLRGAEQMMLTLRVGAERPVQGHLWFNGRLLAPLTIRSRESESYVIGIPRRLVRTIEYDVLQSNVLEWRGTPERDGPRILLWEVRVHAARRQAS